MAPKNLNIKIKLDLPSLNVNTALKLDSSFYIFTDLRTRNSHNFWNLTTVSFSWTSKTGAKNWSGKIDWKQTFVVESFYIGYALLKQPIVLYKFYNTLS